MAHRIKIYLLFLLSILLICSFVAARDVAKGGTDKPANNQNDCDNKPADNQNASNDQPANNQNAGNDKPTDNQNAGNDQPADNQNAGNDQPADNQNAGKDQPADNQNAGNDQPADNQNDCDNKPADNQNASNDQPANNQNAGNDKPADNQNAGNDQSADNQNAGKDQPADNQNAGNDQPADNQNAGNNQPADNQNAGNNQPADNQNAGNDQPADNQNAGNDQPADNQNPGIDKPTDPNAAAVDGGSDYTAPPLETEFLGSWVIDNPNAGVAAMQLQLMPNDKVVWFDTTANGPSAIKMQPEGNCPLNPDTNNQPDCYAHAIAYDWKTSTVRTLTLQGDAWCSSGNLWPNGNMVATGGTFSGNKAVRMIPNNDDPNADFDTRLNVLADGRWYSSNIVLPDGSAVVLGGRGSFSYEILPPSLDFQPRRFDLPFLEQTTTPAMGPGRPVENNLYPFQFLLPDGNIFLFANNKAICYQPQTGAVVREYPELPGGSRNYPPSGSAALLPLKLTADKKVLKTEVVICGGNSPNAYQVVDARHVTEKEFMPALRDCHRIQPLNPDAAWVDEDQLPTGRTMSDLIQLPTADFLMVNGAQRGTSGWEDSTDANFTPLLYSPTKPAGNRFKPLTPTNIARMYHSCSALLPDTRVLVAGSNPHQFYTLNVQFPTELRVEKFSPPYLDPAFDQNRPVIDAKGTDVVLAYGKPFKVTATLPSNGTLVLGEIMVTLVYPPFTTHGFSQNQRMLIPALTGIQNNVINAVAPAEGAIAPPGYYMLFVDRLGVPGPGIWVHIQ
ncbi:hypothetical protein L2E82_11831 [Cichorium intybus]|uniref:Uncharacterized protein n=1 Tax=Cichorium intybus TaxID=13427 RepID=A0ACB9GFK2_CICIN|nr:hypothetical protein L2E82_11831 [Cichorium intybus]